MRYENRPWSFFRILCSYLLLALAGMAVGWYGRELKELAGGKEETKTISTIYLPMDSTYIDNNGHLQIRVELVRK